MGLGFGSSCIIMHLRLGPVIDRKKWKKFSIAAWFLHWFLQKLTTKFRTTAKIVLTFGHCTKWRIMDLLSIVYRSWYHPAYNSVFLQELHPIQLFFFIGAASLHWPWPFYRSCILHIINNYPFTEAVSFFCSNWQWESHRSWHPLQMVNHVFLLQELRPLQLCLKTTLEHSETEQCHPSPPLHHLQVFSCSAAEDNDSSSKSSLVTSGSGGGGGEGGVPKGRGTSRRSIGRAASLDGCGGSLPPLRFTPRLGEPIKNPKFCSIPRKSPKFAVRKKGHTIAAESFFLNFLRSINVFVCLLCVCIL